MVSRRSILALAAWPGVAPLLRPTLARGAGRGTELPPAALRYPDPATDIPVIRLTDPTVTSLLPPAASNPISRRAQFLLYASDLSGRWEAYRMELKKGEARQLTDAEALIPSSVFLLPGERGFAYLDGDRLMTANMSGENLREVGRASQGFEFTGALHVTSDQLYAAVVERRGDTHRLRLIDWRRGAVTTLAEADEQMAAPVTRPKRASVLYRRNGSLWLANFDGKQNYRLRLAEGEVAQAEWSPDGRSVIYLNIPGPGQLNAIRDFLPDSNQDRTVAETSQFIAFARNADASMFVGASGAKATPYILLLVRAAGRELTLCEHRASDPRMAAPVFSSNSQRVFFTSDLHGKPALYMVTVEDLVTATEEENR